MRREILTFCPICTSHCSSKVTVDNGEIIGWEPETLSGLPSDHCPSYKGLANGEISSHPDRLKYPQKRVGAKGEGKWERISWDEALDTIAEKLTAIKEKFGPEYFAIGLGEYHGLEFAFGERLASAFGTPNVSTPRHLCDAPRNAGNTITTGMQYLTGSRKGPPGLLVFWGNNAWETGGSGAREGIKASLAGGAKLAVIDPKRIDIAKRADLWIKPRPGGDGALVMGILKEIIERKVYDEDFVAKWTVGFDKLQEHVATFTLDDVERASWVPRRQIEELVELYAENKPVAWRTRNRFSQVHNIQINRAITILDALTGCVGVPGAEPSTIASYPFPRPGRVFFPKGAPRDAMKSLGGHPFSMKSGYIPYQALTNAVVNEKPYPIKAALFLVCNPLCSYPNARKAYDMMMKLDFSVVMELFMTPTAALADIVLPAATLGEYDAVAHQSQGAALYAFPKLVEPPGEAWSDPYIINEIGKRLGLGEYFPWNSDRDIVDFMLQTSGITWEEFQEKRVLGPTRESVEPEEGRFETPSGKVEIYCEQMREQYDCSPMPTWEELSDFPFEPSEEYPLLMTTALEKFFPLGSFKMIDSLRKRKPDPLVELNPETARELGLVEGEWVYIESKLGRITQKLYLDPDLDPRVVMASFGWWFPETPANAYGWDTANVNLLIDDEPVEPITGSVEARCTPVRVYKKTD